MLGAMWGYSDNITLTAMINYSSNEMSMINQMNAKSNNPKARVSKLCELLNRYNKSYHQLDKPEVPDEVYDALFHELLDLEKKHPDLKSSTSPTLRVGSNILDKFELYFWIPFLYSQ